MLLRARRETKMNKFYVAMITPLIIVLIVFMQLPSSSEPVKNFLSHYTAKILLVYIPSFVSSIWFWITLIVAVIGLIYLLTGKVEREN